MNEPVRELPPTFSNLPSWNPAGITAGCDVFIFAKVKPSVVPKLEFDNS